MVTPTDRPDAAAASDPVMDRLQARMRMLMLIAFGTLGIGVIAVVVALAIRVNRADNTAPYDSRIDIATPGSVTETALDGDRVMLTIDGPEGKVLEIHELRTGRFIGRARLIGK